MRLRSLTRPSAEHPSRRALSPALLGAMALLAGCEETPVIPVVDTPPGSIVTVATGAQDPAPPKGQAPPLGTGWYANVEVDDEDRIHLAWTNADVGDAKYAVTAPGAAQPGPAEVIERDGAVGAFLRLALAPGGAPVVSYYDQDDHLLRLAHRPSDLPRMKAGGADVDEPQAADKVPAGWVQEDVAFGDHAGLGSSLFVDRRGRAHVVYYVKGERLRYARRPEGLKAFGGAAAGIFEKLDVDQRAGSTSTLITDLVVEPDGTVVASYCDFGVLDAALRLAVREKGEGPFRVVPVPPPDGDVEGWASSLLPRGDGLLDVASVSSRRHDLLFGAFDPRAPAPPSGRSVLVAPVGPAVAKRGPDGTLWVLTRSPGDRSRREEPALTLYELPGGDAARVRRYILEKSAATDSWFDLAVRKSGRPVAVWASAETKSLKMYAP